MLVSISSAKQKSHLIVKGISTKYNYLIVNVRKEPDFPLGNFSLVELTKAVENQLECYYCHSNIRAVFYRDRPSPFPRYMYIKNIPIKLIERKPFNLLMSYRCTKNCNRYKYYGSGLNWLNLR